MILLPLRQKLKIEPAFIFLLVLVAALFLSGLGAYRDFVRAESYFALGSRLMLNEGDWLAPHAPDEPVLNKPPLQYWLTGIAYKIFGANYAAARLPSALAALCVLVVVYLLGARLYGRPAGLLSVGILTSSYLFYTFARTAMSDMLLTLCATSALYCFILALTERREQRGSLAAFCGYVFIALGMLAKGPVAAVLVCGPILFELIFSRELSTLKRLRIFAGALIILAIATPYFLLLYLKLGAAPLYAFFVGENLQRFTGEIYAYATRPIWYLPLALVSDLAPWSLLLFPAIYLDWRSLRAVEPDERRARRLLYLWLFFPLVFFSFSHFKLDYYLLPAMPAGALIIGKLLARAGELPLWARLYIYAFLILFALLIFSGALISIRFAQQLNLNPGLGWLLAILSLSALLFILYSLRKGSARRALWSFIFSIWLLLLWHEGVLAPALSRYQPVESFAASIQPMGAHIYTSPAASDWANTLAFHLPPGQTVTRMAADAGDAKLEEILQHEPRTIVLIKEEEYERLLASGIRLRSLAEGETLGHGGLTLNLLRRPRLERLRIVQGQDESGER